MPNMTPRQKAHILKLIETYAEAASSLYYIRDQGCSWDGEYVAECQEDNDKAYNAIDKYLNKFIHKG